MTGRVPLNIDLPLHERDAALGRLETQRDRSDAELGPTGARGHRVEHVLGQLGRVARRPAVAQARDESEDRLSVLARGLPEGAGVVGVVDVRHGGPQAMQQLQGGLAVVRGQCGSEVVSRRVGAYVGLKTGVDHAAGESNATGRSRQVSRQRRQDGTGRVGLVLVDVRQDGDGVGVLTEPFGVSTRDVVGLQLIAPQLAVNGVAQSFQSPLVHAGVDTAVRKKSHRLLHGVGVDYVELGRDTLPGKDRSSSSLQQRRTERH